MEKEQKAVVKRFVRDFELSVVDLKHNTSCMNLNQRSRENADKALAILQDKLTIMLENKPGNEKAMKKAIKLNKLFEDNNL